MQTLKYVIGKDYRPLTTLEAKSSNVSNIDYGNNPNWVQARQYEDGLRQVFVEITNEDGSPYDLTGANVLFEGILPDNEHKILDNSHVVFYEDPTAGKFRFDMPAQAFSVAGQYKQAFFRVMKGYRNIATLEFKFEVLADWVISGLQPRDYLSPLEEFYTEISNKLTSGKGNMDKIVSDFKISVNQMYEALSSESSATKTLVEALSAKADELAKQIEQGGLVTKEGLDNTNKTILNSQKINIAIDDGVREPFKTALSNFYETINPNQNVAKILLVTDSHFMRSIYEDEYGKATDRALIHLQHMGELRDKLDLVVFNGDNVHGRELKEITKKRINQIQATSNFAFGDTPTILTIGNHDDNNVYFNGLDKVPNHLTLSELKSAFNVSELYGYRDFKDKKLRVIVLNSFENPELYTNSGMLKYDRATNSVFSEDQLTWLANYALKLPSNDYHVLIFMHCPPAGYMRNLPYKVTVGSGDRVEFKNVNHDLLLGILKAFTEGTFYKGVGTNPDYPTTITCDFTAQGKSTLIGIVTGHEHRDSNPQEIDGVRVFLRTSDLADKSSGIARVIGDVSEDAFDVIEVDTANRKINFDRFGAGTSLNFAY